MKIVWHKHNLMISSFIGSCQYSRGISYEFLPGWAKFSVKKFQLNIIASLICFFFQIAISLLPRVATFSGQLYFWRSYFFTFFLHRSDFSGISVTFLKQLLFSLFLEQSLLRSSHFFRTASFSEWKFYRAAIFWKY